MAVISTPPFQQFFDNNGDPLSGGKIHTYRAGTTNPKNTFTDSNEVTPMPNPIILDAAGRTVFFITGSYKFKITDANDNEVRTVDNITAFNVASASSAAFFQPFSGNGSQTSFTLSQDLGTDENSLMVFVNGTPTTLNVPFQQTLNSIAAQTVFTLSQDLGTDPNAILVFVKDATKGYEVLPYPQYTISGTSLTLAVSPGAQTAAVIVFKNPILGNTRGFEIQPPNAYTVVGTSLTFAVAPPSGTNNIMVFCPSTAVGAASSAAAAAQDSADDAADSAADSLAQANISTAQAGISTTQAGISTAQAVIATTQAGIATTQAGVSTTQAGISTANAALTAADVISSAANAATATTQAQIATAATAWQYTYSSTTASADPGAGLFRFNNATLSSVTALYISETTALAQNIATEIASWDDSTSVSKGRLKFVKRSDPTTFAHYYITGTITDNGGWDSYTLNYITSNGTFTDADSMTVQFTPAGDAGSPSVVSELRWADTVGGTATNVALTFSPAIGALADGQLVVYRSANASVASMTASADGGGNIPLRKLNNAAIAAGDFFGNDNILLSYNSTLNIWNVLSATNKFNYAVVASASTLSIPSGATFINVTGSVGINAIGNIFDGQTVILRHNATLTYTASGTFLMPFGAATLVVNSGDMVVVFRDGSGFTRIAQVYRASQVNARGDLGFIEPFESAEITYANGSGNYSTAHGLGAIPRFAQMVLRCKTSEHNYPVGAEILPSINGTTSNFINVVKSATSVTALQTGNFPMVDANTLVAATPTPANWRVVFYASR